MSFWKQLPKLAVATALVAFGLTPRGDDELALAATPTSFEECSTCVGDDAHHFLQNCCDPAFPDCYRCEWGAYPPQCHTWPSYNSCADAGHPRCLAQ